MNRALFAIVQYSCCDQWLSIVTMANNAPKPLASELSQPWPPIAGGPKVPYRSVLVHPLLRQSHPRSPIIIRTVRHGVFLTEAWEVEHVGIPAAGRPRHAGTLDRCGSYGHCYPPEQAVSNPSRADCAPEIVLHLSLVVVEPGFGMTGFMQTRVLGSLWHLPFPLIEHFEDQGLSTRSMLPLGELHVAQLLVAEINALL